LAVNRLRFLMLEYGELAVRQADRETGDRELAADRVKA
jgi:hypothetical protein